MSFIAEQPVSAYRDTASGRAGRYDARRGGSRVGMGQQLISLNLIPNAAEWS